MEASLTLEGTNAWGLLLMACTSGGKASNMFAYFSRADLALSVSMTALCVGSLVTWTYRRFPST